MALASIRSVGALRRLAPQLTRSFAAVPARDRFKDYVEALEGLRPMDVESDGLPDLTYAFGSEVTAADSPSRMANDVFLDIRVSEELLKPPAKPTDDADGSQQA